MSRQYKFSGISPKQDAIIEQVTQSGFFVDVTFKFLQQNCQNEDDDDEKEVGQLRALCLNHLHVRSIGQIADWCPKLVVCILPNNHLTSISALDGCVNLVKLDIHGNQLSEIPDEKFWSEMKHLEFLCLHDNPIALVDTVGHLASCPKLTALTIYDTPLSLINKYRHHVVNTLSVLKALDHYVIADEEIVEDLQSTKRFTAFRPELKINLCSSSNQKISTCVALKQVTMTRRSINQIMAHHSPVIIIQKWIRSYLTRQRLNRQPKTGLMVTTSSEPRTKKNLQLYNLPTACNVTVVPETTQFQSEQAETSIQSSNFAFAPPQTPESPESKDFQKERTAPRSTIHHLQSPPFPLLANILHGTGDGIHLQKTHSETSLGNENDIYWKRHNNVSESKKSSNSSKKLKSKIEEMFPLTFIGDEIPISNFCLQGLKKDVLSADAFSELVLIHHETGTAIRDIHTKLHTSPDTSDRVMTESKFRISKSGAMNERFQKRILKQVKLSRLFAIQQAYQDQQMANSRRRRAEETQQRSNERWLARERRQILQEEKRFVTLQEKELLKQQIDQGIKENAVKKTEYLEKQREIRNKSQLALSRTEDDIGFMQEFAKKQFSISRALLKHDKQQLEKEMTLQKSKSVKEIQDQLQGSQEKIKNFQRKNIVERQAKNNEQNDKIRNSFLNISRQKLKESQMRVIHLKKGRRKSVPYNLPLITVNDQGNENSQNDGEQCGYLGQDKTNLILGESS